MKLASTLVRESFRAYDILESVPQGSIVLFPEGCGVERSIVERLSSRKDLFVIFNEYCHEGNGSYNAMIGMEKGRALWRVRKHFLWQGEKNWVDSPPKPEPMVDIRGKKAAVVICYEISKVAGFGRLWTLGKIMAEEKAEMLLMPAVWAFNWQMPKWVAETCLKKIPSLKACAFSCSNTRHEQSYAMIKTRNNGYVETKETNTWVSCEI